MEAALKDLIRLQKEKTIVIKPCVKGAGIIILNFTEYMRACYSHLASLQADNQPYYTQVNSLEVSRTQNIIENTLKEALEKKIITGKEYNGMVADDKDPGRFYCTFKVHKPYEHGKAPPERPIISGSGSITEGIATHVNHHIKEIGKHRENHQTLP